MAFAIIILILVSTGTGALIALYFVFRITTDNAGRPIKPMSSYEKGQMFITIIQSLVLIGTLIWAYELGTAQIEIGSKQTDISDRQAKISQSQLEIPYIISIEIAYNYEQKKFEFYNKGQTNIYLWGNKLGISPAVIESEPRLITPNGSYYIYGDAIESEVISKFPKGGEMAGILLTYMSNQLGKKYIISTELVMKVNAGKVTIDTQTTSIKPQDWK